MGRTRSNGEHRRPASSGVRATRSVASVQCLSMRLVQWPSPSAYRRTAQAKPFS